MVGSRQVEQLPDLRTDVAIGEHTVLEPARAPAARACRSDGGAEALDRPPRELGQRRVGRVIEVWVHNIENSSIATTLMADLGSMLELNLLYTFAPDRSPTRVLEVGGGYGRTAEATLNVFARSVKWVMG